MILCVSWLHVGNVLQMKVKVKPVGLEPLVVGTTFSKPLTPGPATSPYPSVAQLIAASPALQLTVSVSTALTFTVFVGPATT